VYNVRGTVYGPVVVRPKSGGTWRAKKSEGGGCLHDYASHIIDLMNFIVGPPESVLGADLRSVYSKDVEDVVQALFRYPNGASGYVEANWSDETHRKISATVVVTGTRGKIIADRQECRVYLRAGCEIEGYPAGWTVRYITDLQEPVAFYLRGEEYSAQIESFIAAIRNGVCEPESSFASAYETDRVVDLISKAARAGS
jgi:predicted dehydrogenase